jgi:hypothetical protein
MEYNVPNVLPVVVLWVVKYLLKSGSVPPIHVVGIIRMREKRTNRTKVSNGKLVYVKGYIAWYMCCESASNVGNAKANILMHNSKDAYTLMGLFTRSAILPIIKLPSAKPPKNVASTVVIANTVVPKTRPSFFIQIISYTRPIAPEKKNSM